MKSVFDGYVSSGRAINGELYFAGANTGSGFRSSYCDIASEEQLERLYIIKGSAGCGKSTLISEVGKEAEREGHHVSYYLCGSDPESLDCAVIDGRVALLDGTPPHSVDMTYAGAKSELVDLSRFLDKAKLERSRDEIIRHVNAKREAYSSAYRYLSAAERIEGDVISSARSLFDSEKARAFAERFIRKLIPKNAGRGGVRHRYSHAVTMKGLYRAERNARQTYVLRDSMRCAPLLLGVIADAIMNAGCDMTVLHLPISNHIAGIELPQLQISIVTHEADGAAGVINTSRFVRDEAKASVRGGIRLGAAVETSCMEAAVSYLSSAAEHHFALEGIYSSSMDFERADEIADALCRDVMRRL